MPFNIQTTTDGVTVELTGSVTARDAGSLATDVAAAVTSSSAVVVNASDVVDVDTCILQLLVALRKTVPSFRISDASEALVRAADRCAIRRELLSGSKEDV